MPKIPADTQKLILDTWKKHNLPADGPTGGWSMRRKAQTDGYWLAKNLLAYRDFSDCHREIFDFFVKKDPDAEDFKAFGIAYTGSHDDLLMLCRGAFKSTADIVDAVQWTICFPDIRINIMTGTVSLAEEFVELYKGHFKCNKDGSPAIGPDGKPRLFQILFPEHCLYKMTDEAMWTTPARRRAVAGPTIRATSIDTNTTGTHCDVLKCDDCTTAENTNTTGRIRSVNQAITQARRLVEPYGFKVRIGTPYDPSDNLAATINDEAKRSKKGLEPLVKVLFRPAFSILPGNDNVPIDELTQDMVQLWFPDRISLSFLQKEYLDSLKSDPKSFFSQYMLSLDRTNVVKFTRDQLDAASVPYSTIPDITKGQIFQAWDLAYGETNSSDYSCGITGLFCAGRIYILDFLRGRYNENDLPRVVAGFAFKWRPNRLTMEDSIGTKWLKKEIRREMDKLQYNGPCIEYFPIIRNTSGSKVNRAQPVIRLMNDQRLVFSNEITMLETFKEEAAAFPTKSKQHGKDDMVDALAHLVNYFYVDNETAAALDTAWSGLTAKDEAWHNHVHGLDRPIERQMSSQSNDIDSRDVWTRGLAELVD